MINTRLRNLLCEFFALDNTSSKCELESHMRSMDSLDQIDLYYKIEDEFNVRLNKVDKIDDFDDLVKTLENIKNNGDHTILNAVD